MINLLHSKLKMLVPLILFIVMAISQSAYAASYIYDDAGLLFDTEEAQLQTKAKELSDKTGWDVIIVTSNDAQDKTAAAYADDYYDSIGGENGVLYLVDMDNGELYISTSGESIKYLTDKRIQLMLDDAINYAYDGDFYQAISSEISMTDGYYNSGIPNNEDSAALFMTVLFAAIIIGAIAAAIAVFSVKKRYGFKDVGNIYEYNTKSKVNLSVNSDRLVNSFVTTRIRPRPKNNGGGFGGGSSTHTSSSGRTHGGGGRSF